LPEPHDRPEDRSPVVVALVGPASSGKSAVREALARRGAATIDFDDYSRDLLRPGTEEYGQLRASFGDEVLLADGSVDRAALAARAFSNGAARQRLNGIVHPPMLARLCVALAEFRAEPGTPVLVVEGAILGQLPTEGWFDRVVLVTAPSEVRAQRLRAGKGVSEEMAARLIALHEEMGVEQGPADEVVVNDGDRAALQARADELWEKLTRLV